MMGFLEKTTEAQSSGSHVAGYLISSTVVHCVWVGCHIVIPVVKVPQNLMERYFFEMCLVIAINGEFTWICKVSSDIPSLKLT